VTRRSLLATELSRYLVVGVVNTAITYVLLVVGMRWLPYLVAYTIVYAFGVALAYWLQSRFVFRVALGQRKAALFPFIGLAQYALGFVLLWALVDRLALPARAAALIVVVTIVPLGFVLSRLLLTGRPASSDVKT